MCRRFVCPTAFLFQKNYLSLQRNPFEVLISLYYRQSPMPQTSGIFFVSREKKFAKILFSRETLLFLRQTRQRVSRHECLTIKLKSLC